MYKSERREAQSRKVKHSRTTSRAFLHTLDRLAAERDRERLDRNTRRSAQAAKAEA